jgi:hypothetical protein
MGRHKFVHEKNGKCRKIQIKYVNKFSIELQMVKRNKVILDEAAVRTKFE